VREGGGESERASERERACIGVFMCACERDGGREIARENIRHSGREISEGEYSPHSLLFQKIRMFE